MRAAVGILSAVLAGIKKQIEKLHIYTYLIDIRNGFRHHFQR